MSDLKVKNALLEGAVPVFPDALKLLRTAQDATLCRTIYQLEKAAKKVRGYIRGDRLETSDGYKWFFALIFKRGKSEFAILFPWTQDFNAPDGNTNDRSPAVYLLAGEWGHGVEQVIAELCAKMFKHCHK